MNLDARLAAAAAFVTKDAFVVDVGTDHGYLPVWLVENQRARKALATDVNEGPLDCARGHIAAAGLSDQITLALADGLTGLDLSDKTDVVIAGMGGILISQILAARHPLTGLNLILQPMTQAEHLRRWLCEKGYRILREAPVFAGGKGYTVINARFDGEVRECTPFFALAGKIPGSGSPDRDRYLRLLLKKLSRKAEGLAASRREPEALSQTKALLERLEEVLNGNDGKA